MSAVMATPGNAMLLLIESGQMCPSIYEALTALEG